jgi:hypothetical protein
MASAAASVWAFRQNTLNYGSGGGGGAGVTQLVAGNNITLDPPSGVGIVEITSAGGGGTVGPVLNNISNINALPSGTGTLRLESNVTSLTLTGSGLAEGIVINSGAGPMTFVGPSNQFQNGIDAPQFQGGVFNVLEGGAGLGLQLQGVFIKQPIIQYGTVSTPGGSTGSVIVNLPHTYDVSYVVQVTMQDINPAQMAATVINNESFEIYWQSGGGGPHLIGWTTFGS